MVSVKVARSKIISAKLLVDFTKLPWSALNYHNLSPFHIKEAKRICSAYKTGLFPGSIACQTGSEPDEQMSYIKRFHNYLQFAAITQDEVRIVRDRTTSERNGKSYLTTKYFRRRQEGWQAAEEINKEGTVVGYFVNGFVYHSQDVGTVHELIFKNVYYRLIAELPEFIQLLTYLKTNYELELTGLEESFLIHLKLLLLEKAKE
ncbi:MAG: hypothetical protein Solivirus3_21 [Solivirus sp.]|uniref:Uncharacterized protein n=1 Tax=Solivirus sp. TaxID=2487772 RepID=A0A3G5AI91_9VIRU|nr:MAG: hypothetical protein Solivirus3_21 [Solivirus sp.]